MAIQFDSAYSTNKVIVSLVACCPLPAMGVLADLEYLPTQVLSSVLRYTPVADSKI